MFSKSLWTQAYNGKWTSFGSGNNFVSIGKEAITWRNDIPYGVAKPQWVKDNWSAKAKEIQPQCISANPCMKLPAWAYFVTVIWVKANEFKASA